MDTSLVLESPTASAVIDLLDLLRELKEVVWWMRLGQEMGVPKCTLEGIRCQYAMFGEDMCMTEMLSTWLNSRVDKPTWTEVVSAVSRAGSKRLAQRIAEKHGLPLAALTEANTAVDPESPTASPVIKLLDLVRELKEVGWMPLGLEMGVPIHTLKSIRCQYAVQGEDMCMIEMLSTWLDSHVEEPTWAEVVSAVSCMGNKRVARRIAKKHGVDLASLTEVNTASKFSSDVMASCDPLGSLRREVGVSYQAIEDNDLQLEHHTRKKRELEDDRTEIRHNCEIVQKFTKMLEDNKKSLEQKLEEREKEIATLHAKELDYERKIGKLEVKLATAGTTKQKYKEKLRTLKQKKEELVECIEAKQREVDALSKDVNKLTMKLEGAERELSFARNQLELKSLQFDEFQQELRLVQDQRDKLKKELKVQEKALEEAAMQSVGSDTKHSDILKNTTRNFSERYRELHHQHPSYHPHQHAAETCKRECGEFSSEHIATGSDSELHSEQTGRKQTYSPIPPNPNGYKKVTSLGESGYDSTVENTPPIPRWYNKFTSMGESGYDSNNYDTESESHSNPSTGKLPRKAQLPEHSKRQPDHSLSMEVEETLC